MDFLSKFPVTITTATMVYNFPIKIDPEKIIYNDDIINEHQKDLLRALCVKIIYNNKIYPAKVKPGEICICGIKDIKNAHVIFNKIIIQYGLTPITYNDLKIELINASCKFPPIKDLEVKYKKCKFSNIIVYNSGTMIITARSVHILTEHYINLYSQYLLPTILWFLYQSNVSIFHYIPKELMQLIINYVTNGLDMKEVQKVKIYV
jgi:hypothetical protein